MSNCVLLADEIKFLLSIQSMTTVTHQAGSISSSKFCEVSLTLLGFKKNNYVESLLEINTTGKINMKMNIQELVGGIIS